MITVTKPIHFAVAGKRKKAVKAAKPLEEKAGSVGRIPRVSKLMALAIQFDQLLKGGVVANQSELAKLAHVTQPRMTQIMNLLYLAPDIQEEILHLPLIKEGKDSITERDLRRISGMNLWSKQRKAVKWK